MRRAKIAGLLRRLVLGYVARDLRRPAVLDTILAMLSAVRRADAMLGEFEYGKSNRERFWIDPTKPIGYCFSPKNGWFVYDAGARTLRVDRRGTMDGREARQPSHVEVHYAVTVSFARHNPVEFSIIVSQGGGALATGTEGAVYRIQLIDFMDSLHIENSAHRRRIERLVRRRFAKMIADCATFSARGKKP
jgi:hypothetical protein